MSPHEVPQSLDATAESPTRFRALSRRKLLVGAAALGGLALTPRFSFGEDPYPLSQVTRASLKKHALVYISPLKSNNEESKCHGEVWYFVDGGSVVIITSVERWKARSIRAGLDQARLWSGDFGTGASVGDRYKQGPSFRARAEIVKDDELFGRMLAEYGKKYASEWGKWKPRFEEGYADESRVLIRYQPLGA